MSTKLDSPCLLNAGDDEPIFVLRAQDKLAPGVIRSWVARAIHNGAPEEKILSAMATADAMEKWHTRKFPD